MSKPSSPTQTDIYYLTGESIDRLKSNPKLEAAQARGIEVLLLTDPVDAFWTSAPLDFGGKPLKSLSQGDIDFGLIPVLEEKSEDQAKPAADEATTIAVYQGCARRAGVRCAGLATADVKRVLPVGDGRDRALERLLMQQNRGTASKPILEINMRHPLVAAISSASAGCQGFIKGSVIPAAGAGADPRWRIAGGSCRFRQPAQPARA